MRNELLLGVSHCFGSLLQSNPYSKLNDNALTPFYTYIHRLNAHEFELTLGGGEGQGSLQCCNSWGRTVLGHN